MNIYRSGNAIYDALPMGQLITILKKQWRHFDPPIYSPFKADCIICMSADDELPTDCPARVMTEKEREEVKAKKIDFQAGSWVALREQD